MIDEGGRRKRCDGTFQVLPRPGSLILLLARKDQTILLPSNIQQSFFYLQVKLSSAIKLKQSGKNWRILYIKNGVDCRNKMSIFSSIPYVTAVSVVKESQK